MDYAESLQYLTQLAPLGIQPGTERLAQVLSRLGNPQERFVAIHIAGTNGKGSTSAFCAALLLEAARSVKSSVRIGLYTSPHLTRLRERIQLGDSAGGVSELRECSEAEFAAALTAVQAAAAAGPVVELTFFEVLTAAAFHYFAAQAVELAVIETGLGGRLDATRLCRAGVTAITSIGLDHTELLGPTLRHIAREKAGIFRANVPAVVACDDPEARDELRREAQRVGAPLWLYGHRGEPDAQPLPPLPAPLQALLPLAGQHQHRNAALAIAAVTRLPHPLAEVLRRETIQADGLRAARWPGRLERIWPHAAAGKQALAELRLTLAPDIEVWIDAAHNPEGSHALADFLTQERRGRALCVMFGVVAGKSATEMLEPLRDAERIFLTRPPSPRGLPPDALARALTDAGAMPKCPVEVVGDLPDEPGWKSALRQALAATPAGGLLMIYGSIFLISAVRAHWYGEVVDPISLQDPAARRRL